MTIKSLYFILATPVILLYGISPLPGDPCEYGTMWEAWYESGINKQVHDAENQKQVFQIIVNTDSVAKNFISSGEALYRNWADTSGWYLSPSTGKMEMMSADEKNKRKSKRDYYLQLADSCHAENNQGKLLVRMVNNSKDTVRIPMQDGSFICILEAQDEWKDWKSVEYWLFSWCGNSYYAKALPPHTENSFVFDIPQAGDFVTTLRFKLLGDDKFYYSNLFKGTIDYCRFYGNESGFGDQLEEFIDIGWMREE